VTNDVPVATKLNCMRLYPKLLLLVAVPLALAVAAVTLVAVRIYEKVLRHENERIAHSELTRNAEAFTRLIEAQIFDLKLLAGDPMLAAGDKDQMLQRLQHMARLWSRRTEALYIHDSQGNVTGTDGAYFSVRDRDYYPALQRGEVVVSKPFVGATSLRTVVFVFVPLHNPQGQRIGALGGTFLIEDILQRIESLRIGASGYGVLIDDDGAVAGVPGRKGRAFLDAVEVQKDAELAELTKLVRAEEKGAISRVLNGEPVHIYFERIAGTPLRMAVVHKDSEMYAGASRLWVSSLLVLVLSLIATALAVYVMRRKLLGPLDALRAAQQRMGDGDLSARAPILAKDELSDLAKSFNDMAEHLAQSKRELEAELQTRKYIEIQAEERERILQNIMENAPAAIFVKDREGRYLAVNERFCEIANRPRAQIVGIVAESLFGADRALRVRTADEEVMETGKPVIYEETLDVKGVARTFVTVKSALVDSGGTPFAVCGLSTDISEQKRLESELRQAQKLESIGRLAGGIAHDFNNLLTAIFGHVEISAALLKNDPRLLRHMDAVRVSAQRGADLTKQLLAFARKQIVEPKIVSLNTLIIDAEGLLQRLIGENIETVTRLSPTTPNVRIDPGQFTQIVMNLAVNARDAMPGGGKITFETIQLDIDEVYSRNHGAIPPGRYAMLSVTDTGTGLSDSAREHLFEPFFTTKEQGKGTGLGLATVYGIIKQHHGHILVESEKGRGTTFLIFLPATTESGPIKHLPSSRVHLSGTGSILLAEDDELLNQLALEILSGAGYRVVATRDGVQALAAARNAPEPFDLLVTDIVMPGLGGIELARSLRAAKLISRVLFVTGYTEEPALNDSLNDRLCGLLQKPFAPDALLFRVSDLLGRKGPSRQTTEVIPPPAAPSVDGVQAS